MKYVKIIVFLICISCSMGFTKKKEDVIHANDVIKYHRGKHFKAVTKVNVTVTAYTASKKENGPNPLVTASGEHVREGIIAVSHDLFHQGFTFGRKVILKGTDGYDGLYVIKDTTSKRLKRTVDIFRWHKKEAEDIGRINQVELVLLDDMHIFLN